MTIDSTAGLIAKFAGIKINLEKIEECIMERDYVEAAYGTANVVGSLGALGEALAIVIKVTERNEGILKLLTRIVEENAKRKERN